MKGNEKKPNNCVIAKWHEEEDNFQGFLFESSQMELRRNEHHTHLTNEK